MTKKKEDLGGVWRTVGGRRIFIKDGQDLYEAMNDSGKFTNLKKTNSQKAKTKQGVKEIKIGDKRDEKLDNYLNKYKDKTEGELRRIIHESDDEIEKISAKKLLDDMKEEDRNTAKKYTFEDGREAEEGDVFEITHATGWSIGALADEGLDVQEGDELQLINQETDGYYNVKNLRTGEMIEGLSEEHLGEKIGKKEIGKEKWQDIPGFKDYEYNQEKDEVRVKKEALEPKSLSRSEMMDIVDKWSEKGFDEEGAYGSSEGGNKGSLHSKWASSSLEGYGGDEDDFVIKGFDMGSVDQEIALKELNKELNKKGYEAKYTEKANSVVNQDIEIRKIKSTGNDELTKNRETAEKPVMIDINDLRKLTESSLSENPHETYNKMKETRDEYLKKYDKYSSDYARPEKMTADDVWSPGYKESMVEQFENRIRDYKGDDYQINKIQDTLAIIEKEASGSLHNKYLALGGQYTEEYDRKTYGDAKVDAAIMREQEMLRKGYTNIATSINPRGLVNNFEYSDMIISGEKNGIQVSVNYNKKGESAISLKSRDKHGGYGELMITEDNYKTVRDMINRGSIGSDFRESRPYSDYKIDKLTASESKEYYDNINKHYEENKKDHYYDSDFFEKHKQKVKQDIISKRTSNSIVKDSKYYAWVDEVDPNSELSESELEQLYRSIYPNRRK